MRSHLSCCIDDVTVVLNAVVIDALLECGLYCGIVGLDKVVLDELNDKRGFS
jgi:hypothetical protein